MAVITTAVVVAAATVYSAVQQRKAAKATKRAQKAQQRQAELAAARERRDAIRQQRVQQGSIEAQAANTGLVGSSAAANASGNVTSRTNENLSFMDMIGELTRKQQMAMNAAAKYQRMASYGEAVASMASSFGGGGGGNPASSFNKFEKGYTSSWGSGTTKTGGYTKG